VIDWIRKKQLHWLYFVGLSLVIAGLAGSHWKVNPYRLGVWLDSSDTGQVMIK